MTTATATAPRRATNAQEPEWMVWALVLGMLVLGLLLKTTAVGHSRSFEGGGVSLRYPAEWSARTDEGLLLSASDSFSSAQYPTGISVEQVPLAEMGTLTALDDLLLGRSSRQSKELLGYRSLRVEAATVAGQQAVLTEYAYIAPPAMGAAAAPPAVVHAQEVLVKQGETLTILTFAADEALFEEALPTWQRILATVTLQ